jgi:hypothetical protein
MRGYGRLITPGQDNPLEQGYILNDRFFGSETSKDLILLFESKYPAYTGVLYENPIYSFKYGTNNLLG